MAREPHYPDDAPVGDAKKAASAPGGNAAGSAPTKRDAETIEGKAAEARSADGKRTKQIVTGAAIGIGSAAIVAALLYANRRGKNDKA